MTQVYINASNVDDYLVESITRPAADPNAGEVYYRYLFRYVPSPLYIQELLVWLLNMSRRQ